MSQTTRRYALSIGEDKNSLGAARKCFEEEFPSTVLVEALDRIDAMIKMYRQQFDFLVCELSSKESEGYILIDSLKNEEDKVKPKSSLLLCDKGKFPELTKHLGDTFLELPSPFTVDQLKAALKDLLDRIEANERSNLTKSTTKNLNAQTLVSSLLEAYKGASLEKNLAAVNFTPGPIHWNEFTSQLLLLIYPFKCKLGRGQIRVCLPIEAATDPERLQVNLLQAWNNIRKIIPQMQFSAEQGAKISGDMSVVGQSLQKADHAIIIVCEKCSVGLEINFIR